MSKPSDAGATACTTPSDREIRVTRVFDAPRNLVWDAWTDPQHVTRWLLGPPGWTMPVCEIDLRPGGAWRFVYRQADGAEMTLSGTYREVAPPERLVSTESWGPDWPETINTLVLTEAGRKTTATLTILYPTQDARDAALRSGMQDGLSAGFDRLDQLVHTLA